jgi:hypothetical protein
MLILLRIVQGLVVLVGGYLVLLIVFKIVSSSESGSITRDLQHEGARTVASDLIDDYNFLVKNGGSPMEICTHARAIVMMYMKAHDSANYGAWKKVQRRDCRRAGVDLQ